MPTNFPTLPSPSTWFAGEFVGAPTLRSDVSNAVDLLTGPPAFFGSQLVTGQSIPTGGSVLTAILLDAEYLDEWNGHRQNSKAGGYYAPLAGFFLCEGGVAFPTAASGMCSAGFQYQSNGSATTTVGTQRAPLSGTHNTCLVGAKIIPQLSILGWGAGDFTGVAAYQNSPGALTAVNATTQFPYFTCRWIGAAAGTAPLPVPVNSTFPSPPTVLSHAFMNTNVRDTINFLIYPPIFEGQYNAGTATLASQASLPAVGTTFGMDNVNFDTYGAYSTSTHNWTAPVSGVYFAYHQAALTMGAGASALAAGLTVTSSQYNFGSTVTLWGGTQAPSASTTNCAVVRRRLRLVAGDTVAAAGWQHDSGAASATILGAGLWNTRFIMVWESA